MHLEGPPPVNSDSDPGFSLEQVRKHLSTIAKDVHFIGSKENRIVKDYLVRSFEELDIETEIFIGQCQISRGAYKRMARTENVIAKIKGTDSSKALMLCAHYDSVLSANGAADDGHAVACMLEVAKELKAAKLKNDVIFLITDGEEMGLLGAQAYTETKDLSNLGLILNYEARGNSGASIAFEWADENGFLVREMRKVGKRPISSSLSYEIYNILPNDTDYSRFKPKGIAGINHAFIEGFSYYHNPEDKLETINWASVKHTGENMLRLAKHFGNMDLNNIKAPNASFFNFFSKLIIYPASWNFALLVILSLLLILMWVKAFTKPLKLGSILLSFLGLVVLIAFLIAIVYGLKSLIYFLYPHYQVFYVGQYYNHMYYLLPAGAIVVIGFNQFYRRMSQRFSQLELQVASFSLLVVLCYPLYLFMSTGSYILILPVLIIAIKLLTDLFGVGKQSKLNYVLPFFFAFMPIAMLLPLTKMLYLAFSISGLFFATAYLSVALLVVFICFPEFFIKISWLTYLGILVAVLSFALAHMKSQPSEEFPIPSSLIYVHDQTESKSYWTTNDGVLTAGNRFLLEKGSTQVLNVPAPRSMVAIQNSFEPNYVPMFNYSKDSLHSEVLSKHEREVLRTRLYFDSENVKRLSINGYEVEALSMSENITIDLFGMTQDSIKIDLEKINPNLNQLISIGSSYRGFPVADQYPTIARRVDGYSIIVQKVNL